MNAKTVKLFRKYARQKTGNASPEVTKRYYKKLKAEFEAHIRES